MATGRGGHSPVKSLGASEYVLCHMVLTIASGSPSIGEDLDDVAASVADTGTGKWTVTLTDKFYLVNGWANCELAAGTHNANVTPTAEGGNTNTVVVTLETGGALADVDCNINVFLLCRRNDA